MNCDLCKREILPDPISGWDRGHNAWPLLEGGRCCDSCNSAVVLTRMSMLARDKEGARMKGQKIRLIREALGETQVQFAARLGGQWITGSRLERGLNKPSTLALAAIHSAEEDARTNGD